MAERFHINSALAPGLLVVRGPEAHHMGTVCRVHPGDAVVLFTGDGLDYPARVVEVTRRDVTLDVGEPVEVQRELPFELHLAVALPRGDRGDFLVEKLTELGVRALHLLRTERSVVQPRETRVDRLQRTVIEACKQCGRNRILAVHPPRPWAEFAADPALPARRLLAHPRQGATGADLSARGPVVAAVGPEGGFTDAEVALAVAHGWQKADLGPRILRIETAAITLAVRLGAVDGP